MCPFLNAGAKQHRCDAAALFVVCRLTPVARAPLFRRFEDLGGDGDALVAAPDAMLGGQHQEALDLVDPGREVQVNTRVPFEPRVAYCAWRSYWPSAEIECVRGLTVNSVQELQCVPAGGFSRKVQHLLNDSRRHGGLRPGGVVASRRTPAGPRTVYRSC
jgi:hypothetical protein